MHFIQTTSNVLTLDSKHSMVVGVTITRSILPFINMDHKMWVQDVGRVL